MSAPTHDPVKFFNLHTCGIGYLNRIRTVQPSGRNARSYLACTIGALRGAADDVDYTYFDVIVCGAAARAVVDYLAPEVEAERQVVIGFSIGDLYAESFVYRRGARQGQTGVALKGRLLKIGFAKVDGEAVDLSRFVEADAPRDEPAPRPPLPPAQGEEDAPRQRAGDAGMPRSGLPARVAQPAHSGRLAAWFGA